MNGTNNTRSSDEEKLDAHISLLKEIWKSHEFFSLNLLKKMGWTPTAVKKFLVKPDKIEPIFFGGNPAHLYKKERVFGVMEKNWLFREWWIERSNKFYS